MKVPLHLLVEHTMDDGADYDDGLMGWSSARLLTGDVLVLRFLPDFDDPDQDPEYEETEYRFRLYPGADSEN